MLSRNALLSRFGLAFAVLLVCTAATGAETKKPPAAKKLTWSELYEEIADGNTKAVAAYLEKRPPRWSRE